jgi:chromosome segregation protein
VKFTRLKVTGFKSFCDPTELHLDPGLTGVVGPNGCGKSNLVEALRWVMGESSYKAMRASGMDDVIFAGSGNRPGRNMAEVTVVLDNSDRTAPAALNNADVLEVTRRIERDSGSAYRVNGREVRARDVQLLFADASTGAHSPALVRQGQIGELIAAKPVERRALLEEAAGISGLHSRRHEAELRLRATDQNLERVDDIVAQVDGQLETLKRQARQAARYRNISGDIRQAEATLYHLRWVAARAAEKETEAEQGRQISQLADATHTERLAAKLAEEAEVAVQPVREAEAAAAAALQRLTINREQLEEEIRRADSRRTELQERLRQIEADGTRERTLVAEADEILKERNEEQAILAAEAQGEAEAAAQARQEADSASAALGEVEAQAQKAADEFAQLRARRAQLARSAEDSAQRIARLKAQIAEIDREAETVKRSLSEDRTIAGRAADLESTQEATARAERAALAAEEQVATRQSELDAARPALEELETRLNRLESEAETLARVLNVTDGALWPPIVDALNVTPGYETALGAALGDDLDASSDTGAPMHWAKPGDGSTDAALPKGATPLSEFVTGAPGLNRRLNQIGLVKATDGLRLLAGLTPGQRLVTLDGDLWRWDGFVAAADAPSAAAQRLSQRNRLSELDAETAAARAERGSARQRIEALGAELDSARQTERAARDTWRESQRSINTAQTALDEARKAMTGLTSRQSALEEARVRLNSSLQEAEDLAAEAAKALATEDDEDSARQTAESRQQALAGAREASERTRLKLGGFENAAALRDGRLRQITSDAESWQRRRQSAEAQLKTLDIRTAETRAQLEALSDAPDGFATRRQTLDAQIEDARRQHRIVSDRMAEAQTRYRDADKAAKAAHDALFGVRETLGRVEERLKGHIVARQQIERLCEENLNIPAARTAEAAGIKPEQSLPEEDRIEARVERLKAERERLGGVNLGAEREAAEVQEKLDIMVADREDLIAAIAKLRTGISSLNREGRARLTEAFDKVNVHFADLFTSLFGGGTAELQFVESDDPLEAGLEIIARPPGKKPQVMTLLSGGEQALTALSLIFAVFLTNPAPICVLDEVDAPLDDANVERFCNLLDSMCERTDTRFVVITHNPITMARANRLFGVTMAEQGVSQLVSVDLSTAHEVAEAS